MAHHRRKTSRLHATRKTSWTSFNRRLAEKGETFHAGRRGWRFYDYDTPTRWDLMKHVRPARRTASLMTRAIETGALDPDEALWPPGGRKPPSGGTDRVPPDQKSDSCGVSSRRTGAGVLGALGAFGRDWRGGR